MTTCGAGSGYCLLGIDCSLDQDFIEDASGHCEGLKGAFTPSAHFVCCRGSRQENEIESDKNEKHEQNNTLVSSQYYLNVKSDYLDLKAIIKVDSLFIW